MPRGSRIEKVFALTGHKIRIAREKTGLSQDELATKVQLKRSSMVLIESGKQRLPIDRLFTIARELGTTPQKLLPEIGEVFEDIRTGNESVTIHGGPSEDKDEVGKRILEILRQQQSGGTNT
jgi:transcriptional regulator with XRE-family HTH domain